MPLSKYHNHHNAACVKCDALDKLMIRVGAVIFCKTCVEHEFKTENPVIQERETYLHWLHKSWEDQNAEEG